MTMHVFIDTNIFLSFYRFSSDVLEELRKLLTLIENGKIQIHLPEQVRDEYRRNREGTIAQAMNSLGEQKLPNQYPQLCKEFLEYAELRELQNRYKKHAMLCWRNSTATSRTAN